jgi:nitroreductase
VTRAIIERRSIRAGFSSSDIPRETLKEIIACGLAAPSSKNAQPWRLHVVTDRAMLGALADEVVAAPGADSYVPHDPVTGEPDDRWVSTVGESAEVLRSCAAAIFIENTGEFSRGRRTLASVPTEHLARSITGYTFEVIGLGAAIQNMWVAATALGVRGTFMGDVVVAEDTISSALGVAGDLVGVLALGYSEAGPHRVRSIDPSDPARVVWHERSIDG